jgi:hypothetical protein
MEQQQQEQRKSIGVREMVTRMYRSWLQSIYRLRAAVQSAWMAMPIPEGIRRSLQINGFLKETRRLREQYNELREEEKTNRTDEEMREIRAQIDDVMLEMNSYNLMISELNSLWLIEEAKRYDVKVPENKFEDREGDWEKSEDRGDWEFSYSKEIWMLNSQARAELRSAIRKEQKERRELWQMKLVWATAITGLIGTLTGFVSALHR